MCEKIQIKRMTMFIVTFFEMLIEEVAFGNHLKRLGID